MQQRVERERKELEQGHVRIIKEYESRVRDLDTANRVSGLLVWNTCKESHVEIITVSQS